MNASGLALVTGAQQGIGAAVAVALGRAGYDVIVNYLDDISRNAERGKMAALLTRTDRSPAAFADSASDCRSSSLRISPCTS